MKASIIFRRNTIEITLTPPTEATKPQLALFRKVADILNTKGKQSEYKRYNIKINIPI